MANNELGHIAVEIDESGVEDALGEIEGQSADLGSGGGSGGGGGGGQVAGMLGGMMKSLGAMGKILTGVLGAVVGIAALLLSMEPIQAMLEGLFKIAQAFLAPVAQLLLKLFAPVLKGLVKLLPMWMEFFKDPVGTLIQALNDGLLKYIFGPLLLLEVLAQMFPNLFGDLNKKVNEVFKDIGSKLVDIFTAIPKLPGQIWDFVKKLPKRIWDFLKQLPQQIVDGLTGVIPGTDIAGGAADTAGGVVDSAVGAGQSLVDGASDLGSKILDVNVSGYNDEETKDVLSRAMRKRGV